ncbi:hypothetical protein ACRRTK_012403 [Alexandromys fortis]
MPRQEDEDSFDATVSQAPGLMELAAISVPDAVSLWIQRHAQQGEEGRLLVETALDTALTSNSSTRNQNHPLSKIYQTHKPKVMVKSDFFQGPELLGDLESRKQDFYYVLFDFALSSRHLALESRTAIPFQCIHQWLQK